jgi:indole-3-glycerol phosphate synthase
VTDARRLSQAISEGDGISVIVQVDDLEQARAAAEQGAEGLALRAPIDGLADEVALPVLWIGDADAHAAQSSSNAHAVIVWVDDERLPDLRARFGDETELVVGVVDEEDLEAAVELEVHVFLLSVQDGDGDHEDIDRVIELLPDVPAGKLAIAEVEVVSREEVLALERAGFDAVLVPPGHIAELVGGAPPEV